MRLVTIENSFGAGFVTIDGTQHNSGVQLNWSIGSQHTLLATNQQYNNYVRVFCYWEIPPNGDPDTRNPLPVTADRNGTYRARMERQFDVTVTQAQYVEPGGSGGTYRINGTDIGSTWQGTYVENCSSPLLLEAVSPGAEWGFTGWSDNNLGNPRTLVPSNNTTLYAIFKKHLVSTNSSATGPNGSRKIVTYAGVSHAAYESGGSIFYIRNDGSGWSGEKLVRFSSSAANPSIAVTARFGQAHVHIAWEEDGRIKYTLSVDAGVAFWEPADLGAGYSPVCAGDWDGAVVWQTGSELRFWPEPILSGTTFLGGVHVSSTDGTARDISMAGRINGFWLAYVKNADSVMAKLIDENWYPPNQYVNAGRQPERLTYGCPWISDCRNTNIVTGDEGPFVSWDGYGTPPDQEEPVLDNEPAQVRRVFVRQRNASQWGPFYALSYNGADNTRASLGINVGMHKAILLWQWGPHGGETVMRSSRTSYYSYTSWGVFSNSGYGIAPSQSPPDFNSSSGAPWHVWTGLSGPPFSLEFSTSGGDDDHSSPIAQKGTNGYDIIEEGSEGSGYHLTRQGTIILDSLSLPPPGRGAISGYMIIQSGRFAVAGNGASSRMDFSTDPPEVADWLGMKARAIPSNADSLFGVVSIAVRNFRINDPQVNLRIPISKITVKVGAANIPVQLVSLSDIVRIGMRDTVVQYKVRFPVHALHGQVASVGHELMGQNAEATPAWSEVMVFDSLQANAALGKKGEAAKQQAQLPRVYRLHQNYPNPFNPSTQLNFDLPEAANVSLIVYDVLGRQVVELANGLYEAGYQSATWNVPQGGIATGVYFARFTATKPSGEVAFSKMTKLLLVK